MNVRPALLATALVVVAGLSARASAEPFGARSHHPDRSASRQDVAEAGPVGYLLAARAATRASRYPAAGEALGRAETRLLNDAAATNGYPPPVLQRAHADVQAARRSAASRQQTPTLQTIDDALLALESQGQSAVASLAAVPPPEPFLVAPASPPLSPPPTMLTPPPAVLYRLEPGHWQLQGARSAWVEAQSIPQPVSVEPLVPSRQVWNGNRWILVPEHFVNTEIPR